ncbi:MAG: hypothetical protein HY936_00090 [Nitrosomonadales bacterium]|nr:hypothetical protein [Nitrosomonadales bacterium]
MDEYLIWRIRCNVISLIGVVIVICDIAFPVFEAWMEGWALYIGFTLLIIGILDAYGYIFQKKARRLIGEHDQKYRDKFKSRQP